MPQAPRLRMGLAALLLRFFTASLHACMCVCKQVCVHLHEYLHTHMYLKHHSVVTFLVFQAAIVVSFTVPMLAGKRKPALQ